MYNKNVSEKVRDVTTKIEMAQNADEIFVIVTDFYKDYGVGMFGLNKAFRIDGHGDELRFHPINNTEQVYLNDLVGYEIQKKSMLDIS